MAAPRFAPDTHLHGQQDSEGCHLVLACFSIYAERLLASNTYGRDNHALMCIIFDTYFQWNENAARMCRFTIPRNVPVFMPMVEWRENGVPLNQVKVFNRFVADLCRTNFSPWCSICRRTITPENQFCMSLFPHKRLCPICKTDAFVSDHSLWAQYNISMRDLIVAPKAEEAVEEECIIVAPDDDEDDDDTKKKRKKGREPRPPPKLKKPRRRRMAPHIKKDAGETTLLQHIVESCPDVYYFTHIGTRHQRLAVTCDSKDLDGPKMNQKLIMIFFLKSDLERIIDFKAAAEHKKSRDMAASVIGAALLRRAGTRDTQWALPWYASEAALA